METVKAWCVRDIEYGICPKTLSFDKDVCEKKLRHGFFDKNKYKVVAVQVEIKEVSDD